MPYIDDANCAFQFGMMKTFDLAIAWNWEFDDDFVTGIEHQCAVRGISTYRIDPNNLAETIHNVRSGHLGFRSLFDRASDADTEFLQLVRLLKQPSVFVINPHENVVQAIDKSTMHLTLITNGIHVPNSIILPPFRTNGTVKLQQSDLDRVGIPFVIKPANTTGGGTGVVMQARTLNDVLTARMTHADDTYLVQETIVPQMLEGKRAWFRAYCIFHENIICWWDDTTHAYTEMMPDDEQRHGLAGIRDIMKTIQRTCKLDFFSSEIAVTDERKFIVVDYVNEVCDMRLQSKYANGAPDAVVHKIEMLIADRVAHHTGKPEGIVTGHDY